MTRFLKVSCFLLICLLAVSACQPRESAESGAGTNQSAASASTTTQTSERGPTGYTDGIQNLFVFYKGEHLVEGELFIYDRYLGQFTEDEFNQWKDRLSLEYVGSVEKETNYELPSKNMEASRIPVHSPVYIDLYEHKLYVLSEGSYLYRMRVFTEELDPLGP